MTSARNFVQKNIGRHTRKKMTSLLRRLEMISPLCLLICGSFDKHWIEKLGYVVKFFIIGFILLKALCTTSFVFFYEMLVPFSLECRFMFKLKFYERNKSRPEGSTAQWYVIQECLMFVYHYLDVTETRDVRAQGTKRRTIVHCSGA